jgi:hypothetical protein
VRDRDAGQSAGRTVREARIGGLGLRQRQFGIHVQECVVAAAGDAVQVMARQFGGRDLFSVQERGQLLDGLVVHCAVYPWMNFIR